MIQDVNLLCSDKQSMAAFTVAGSPFLSDFSWDQGVAGTPPSGPQGQMGGPLLHDIGRGRAVAILVQITTAVTSAGAATVKADLVAADNAALTTNKNIILSTPAIAKATLVAGYRFRFGSLPAGAFSLNSNEFLGFQYTVATADLTAGAVSAGFGTPDAVDHADIIG